MIKTTISNYYKIYNKLEQFLTLNSMNIYIMMIIRNILDFLNLPILGLILLNIKTKKLKPSVTSMIWIL